MDYKVIEINNTNEVLSLELLKSYSNTPTEFKFIIYNKTDLESILSVENELNKEKINFQWRLNFKELPFEDRLDVMKLALSNEDLIDSTLILNIFNFINSYKEFNSDFFNYPEVIVNKTAEFIDIKNKLRNEFHHFVKELSRYYVSILKSAGVTDFPANSLPKIIPLVYQRILLIADFISLSNIIRTTTEVTDLVFVENAELFLYQLSSRYMLANSFIKSAGLSNK